MTVPKRDIGPQGNPVGEPRGLLSIRTLGMPADTNQYGDIFGGWLLGQMDIAGEFSRLALQREEEQPLLLTQ